jgi:hypothetical protein
VPLTHVVLSVACLVAAVAMLALARDLTSRVAHLVVAVAMAAVLLAPDAVALAAGVLGVVAVGVLLLTRTRHARCALDAAGCAVMMAMMLVDATAARGGTGTHSGMHAMHAMHEVATPGSPIPVLLRAAIVLAVVVAWHLARRRTAGTGARGSDTAAWLMVLGMGAMATAA